MASGSAARKRLKLLSKEVPDERISRGLDRLVQMDTDFVDYLIAINAGTLVDKALEAAILARFVPLDSDGRKRLFDYDQRGPISDFAARTKLGHALGLFGPKTKENLDLIREIRNAFAHAGNHFLSFDKPEVAALFAEMTRPPGLTIAHGGHSPRSAYVLYTKTIASRLTAQITVRGLLNQLPFPVNDRGNRLP